MRDECIEAVMRAAGRSLTQTELKDIESRIAKNRRQLAQTNRQEYLAMTPEQQLRAAAKMAAEQFVQDKVKKQVRVALTIQAHDRIDNYVRSQKSQYGFGTMNSLQRVLASFSDGKSNIQSVETRGKAIAADYIRQLLDTFESTQPQIFGLFTNKEGIRALTYELYGMDSSKIVSPEAARDAKAAAKAWNEIAENARQHFNNAGGDIGRLEDWRTPQNHSQKLVAEAGRDKWVNNVFGKLNRQRYTREDGSYMDDAEVLEFLREAWTSIATGGANKIEPGKIVGRGMKANLHAEERSIHFKDPESYLAYQAEFGGKDAYTVMMQHILRLSNDIALIETLGPNADLQFKYWLDRAVKEDSLDKPTRAGRIQNDAVKTQNLYDFISGRTMPVANWKIAQGFDTLRSWLVATRLGSAFITSITDNATMQLTAAVNKLSHTQLMRNQLATLNPRNKTELAMARRAGLSLQTLIGDMNRWGTEALGPSFSSKMANLTMRASFLNAATEARRRAFGVTMYGSIGNTTRKFANFDKIPADDLKLLKGKGIDKDTFAVWKKAQLEDWGNGNDTMLTPEAIYRIPDKELEGIEGNPRDLRRDAALKLLGMVNEESNMAVIEPGARERSMMTMGTQRGTWKGEIVRSFFLFKGFPLSLIMRHWARGMAQGSVGGKALYIGSLIASTTILGAVAQQLNNIASGRDPQDMTQGKFWAQALMKGGSLGIYGDFVLNTNTQYGNTPLAVLSGPLAGYVEDVVGLTQGSIVKAAQGKKVDWGANAVRFAKSNIPLQNLWYTKAVTDRMIFNQLQEMVSPGYNRRVEQRARSQFNQSYYYRPGELTPRRAPDFGKAFGD